MEPRRCLLRMAIAFMIERLFEAYRKSLCLCVSLKPQREYPFKHPG